MSLFVSDYNPSHWSETADLVETIRWAELIACRRQDTEKEIVLYGARFMVAMSEPENFDMPVRGRLFLCRDEKDFVVLREVVRAIKGNLSKIELQTLYAGWTFAEMLSEFLGND